MAAQDKLPAATRQAMGFEATKLFARVNRAIADRRPGEVERSLGEEPRILLARILEGGPSHAEASYVPEVVACRLLDSHYEHFVLTGRVGLRYRTRGGNVDEVWTIARAAPSGARHCPACGALTAALVCEYCDARDPLREGFVVAAVSGERFAGFLLAREGAPDEREPLGAANRPAPAAQAALGARTRLSVHVDEAFITATGWSITRTSIGAEQSEVHGRALIEAASPEEFAAAVKARLERVRLHGWAASSEIGSQWDLLVRVVAAWDALVAAERAGDASVVAPYVARPLFDRIARPIEARTMRSQRVATGFELYEVRLPARSDIRDVEVRMVYANATGDPDYLEGFVDRQDWWHLKWAPSASDEPDECAQCGGLVPADATTCPYCRSGHTRRQALVLWEMRDASLED